MGRVVFEYWHTRKKPEFRCVLHGDLVGFVRWDQFKGEYYFDATTDYIYTSQLLEIANFLQEINKWGNDESS